MAQWYNQKEKCVGTFRIKLLWWLYKIFGRYFAQIVIFFVVVFLYPFLKDVRRQANDFFKVLNDYQAKNKLKTTKPNVFKLIYNFALSMLDKLILGANKKHSDFLQIKQSPDFLEFQNVLNSGKGAIIIFSHIGNFEILGMNSDKVFKTRKLKITALVEGWSQSVYRSFFLSQQNAGCLSFFDVSKIDISTFEKLSSELAQGNLIIMAGDRLSKRTPDKYFKEDILLKKCKLPSGVFQLSTMLKAPVFFGNCIEANNKYIAEFKQPTCVDNEKKRGEHLAKEFSAFLEASVLQAPYQWYNFFEFFQE